MIPFEEMQYHPTSEKLVETICNRTQSMEPLFLCDAVSTPQTWEKSRSICMP